MAGIKQGRHTRSCTSTKQAEKHYGRSRLGWRNRSSKAQVVRHPCLARSITSAAIVVSTTRTDERDGLNFVGVLKLTTVRCTIKRNGARWCRPEAASRSVGGFPRSPLSKAATPHE